MNTKNYLKFIILPIFIITWIFFSTSKVTDLNTPLEKSNYLKLTSYEDMIEYLQENSEYPIYRVSKSSSVELRSITDEKMSKDSG